MRLQKMIANIVIIMMLFVSVASRASAPQYPSMDAHGCSATALISPCCTPKASIITLASKPGEHCDTAGTASSDKCCQDNQCHSGQVPLAILADELTVAPLEGLHYYKEFEGSNRLFKRAIFRPPVTA
ncbi:hypothetical protein C9J03_12465 [Photobacterium gaetbulicola]|uniref:Uncharacterized protein n=1 Tax=Photobacterium gaetbulicola Gung47 TaxID=658445 RepID=A0A0C5WR36_9GAMM|nr:hypothetical protein [Photobacterium gaetbulicola]AJR08762.1 hypothetical protein H744_2c2098 [Photobacterium gaetbulicola Gung47]PSU10392.1 hypothetical protein C9J03_12465 [Photobacterium gaetbulicola]